MKIEEKDKDKVAESITYTELANQKLSNKINELKLKESNIEIAISEALKAKGDEREKIVSDLRREADNVHNKIYKVEHGYTRELLLMAERLDTIDNMNRGEDLICLLASKTNELIKILPELDRCYAEKSYAPNLYIWIKSTLTLLLDTLNTQIPGMTKISKEESLEQFNEKIERLEDKETSTN